MAPKPHTSTPWTVNGRAHKGFIFGDYVVGIRGLDDRGPCTVAIVRGGNHDDHETTEANAALIVVAVNERAALLAERDRLRVALFACGELLDRMSQDATMPHEVEHVAKRARAALEETP